MLRFGCATSIGRGSADSTGNVAGALDAVLRFAVPRFGCAATLEAVPPLARRSAIIGIVGMNTSSLAFGALWVTLGLQQAVIAFAVGLALALLIAAPLLVRSQRSALHG